MELTFFAFAKLVNGMREFWKTTESEILDPPLRFIIQVSNSYLRKCNSKFANHGNLPERSGNRYLAASIYDKLLNITFRICRGV